MRNVQNNANIIFVLFPIICLFSVNQCVNIVQEHVFRGISDDCYRNYKLNGTVLDSYSSISQVECAVKCVNAVACLGINYCTISGVRSCQMLAYVTAPLSCNDLEYYEGCSYYHKGPCWNGGIYQPDTTTCLCPYLYSGTYCNRYNIDCVEAYERGFRDAATTIVQPNTELPPFEVKCRLQDTPLARIIKRDRDAADLFSGRLWDDYKLGFGTPARKNMWMGLENIRSLIIARDQNFTAKVSINFTGDNSVYVGYLDHFHLAPEFDNYRISFSGYRSDVDKPLPNPFSGNDDTVLTGRPFCTPDRDCGECATGSNSGWWFSQSCAGVNWNLPAGDLVWPNESQMLSVDRVFVDLMLL